MPGVEVATKISELIATAPPGSDPKSEGDNHIRLLKGVLQDVFDDSVDNSFEISEANIRFTWDPIGQTVTISAIDDDGEVLSSLTIGAEGLTGDLANPVIIHDANGIERARLTATTTAGTGGLTLTSKDEASDEESKLIIGPAFLQYSGDDATRIVQLDQSRQAAGTSKLYTPAIISDLSLDDWEFIAKADVSGVTQFIKTDLGAFETLEFDFDLQPDASAAGYAMQLSNDNGVTWVNGANDYYYAYVLGGSSGTAAASQISATSFQLTMGASINPGNTGGFVGSLKLSSFNKTTRRPRLSGNVGYQRSDAVMLAAAVAGGMLNQTLQRNAIRLFSSTAFSGRIKMRGLR